ncbi:MAG: Rieske (2Fe-2S) protein [Phycisphaerae bacterium]
MPPHPHRVPMPGMAYRKLIHLERCPADQGCFVALDGHELAVFRLPGDGRICVTDNTCPHANGNLSGGKLDGCIVTCPWHDWPFDVTTGRCTHSASPAKINCYPVKTDDGIVHVDLDAPF